MKIARSWIAAASVLLLAGCESSAPSPVSFDASRAADALRTVSTPFNTGPLQSLYFEWAAMLNVPPSAAKVPQGTTMTDQGGRYAPDTSRAGAPADGIRFILYFVNADNAVTDSEVGYVDFTGISSVPDTIMHERVVSGGIVYLDAEVVVNEVGSVLGGAAMGTALPGDAVAFAVDETVNPGQYHFGVPAQDFAMDGTFLSSINPVRSTITGTAHLAMTTFAFSTVQTLTDFTADVSVNGRPYAHVAAPGGSALTITRVDGGKRLSLDEWNVVNGLSSSGYLVFLYGSAIAAAGSAASWLAL